MSQCRCKKIEDCNKDIEKFSNAETYLPNIREINRNVDSDLDAIVTKCEYSFTCNCMEEIKAAIYRLTPPFKTSIEDVEQDKNKALFQLRYDKNMYEKEDKAWHEEQLAIARMNSVTKPASTQGGRR